MARLAAPVVVVLRQSLQAMHRVAPIVVTMVGANAVNVFFNWVLIYGNLASPPLGVPGSACATCLSRWLMAAGLLGVAVFLLLRIRVRMRRELARVEQDYR